MRLKWALVAVATTLSLSACSSDPDAAATPSGSSVDPQVFDDVLADIMPVPGKGARRGYVVVWFVRGLGMKECGGAPPKNKYAYRLDQAHYPDLDLIREVGFGDYGPDEKEDFGPNPETCTELLSDQVTSKEAMNAISSEWGEKVRELDNGPLAPILVDVGDCLSAVVGVTLPKPVIDFYITDHVDASTTKAQDQRLVDGFLRCTPPYFDALREALLEVRPEWVERHREALEKFASELTAAGYVP